MDLTSAHLSCQVAGALGPVTSQQTPRPSSRLHRPGWARCHCPQPSTGCPAESLLTSVWQGPPLQPSTAHQCRMVSSKDLAPSPFSGHRKPEHQKEELPEAKQPSLHAEVAAARLPAHAGNTKQACEDQELHTVWSSRVGRVSFQELKPITSEEGAPAGVASLQRSAAGASQEWPQCRPGCRRLCVCWSAGSAPSAAQGCCRAQAAPPPHWGPESSRW